ncbi:MAG: hypothetical protein HEEMFOPI_01621 [Holosporales bacterium]
MHIIFYFLLLVGFQLSAANDATPQENHCRQIAFPNYFKLLNQNEALNLINQAIGSVLSRLKVPYVVDGRAQNEQFFKELNDRIQEKAPGAKVYIAGGMVRSILGYIYKKIHNEATNRGGVMTRERVLAVMERIIMGQSRKDPLPFQDEKDLTPLDALGIGSDYDILIDFSNIKDGNISQAKHAAETFMNSLESHYGLRDDQSPLKRAVVPVADVKDYHEQIKRASQQGGSSLDWLAYPIIRGEIRQPENHPDIMTKFINGELQYLNAQNGMPAKDKQTIRGLRALLEIPFLRFDEPSKKIVIDELKNISSLSTDAQEQIKKMLRNARLANANNRFQSPCMGDDDLISVIQNILQEKIPTYLPDQRTKLDQDALPSDMPPLMPVGDFIKDYTDHGVLYHGTKDLMNLLAILRNGFYISKNGQGIAVQGSGVYTTKKKSTAEGYATGGIVLPLTVRTDLDLRILNKDDKKIQEEWRAMDNETLAKTYGIDIIIDKHVILQNARVIKKQKNVTDIIRAIQNDMIQKIHAGNYVNLNQANLVLSPYKGYSLLAKVFDPNYQAPDEHIIKSAVEKHLKRINIEESLRSYIIQNFDFFSSLIDFNSDKATIEQCARFTRENEDIAKDFFAMFDSYNTAIQFLRDSPKRENIDSLIQLVKAGVLGKLTRSDLYREVPTLNKEQVEVRVYFAKKNIMNNISVIELEYFPKDFSMAQANIIVFLVKEGVIDKTSLIHKLKNFPKDFTMEQANILIHLVSFSS